MTKAHSGNAAKVINKTLPYLDNFKDILSCGEPEKKKGFIGMFVKGVIMYPKDRRTEVIL